jgi:hypothetical protein
MMFLIGSAVIAGSGVYEDGGNGFSQTPADLVRGTIGRENATFAFLGLLCKRSCMVHVTRVAGGGSRKIVGHNAS